MPKGKPVKKPVSEAQRRYMFVLEREGQLPKGEARAKSHAVKGRDLPEHVKKKKR
jgi:hypothetical protein